MARNTRWMSLYTQNTLTILLPRPFADLFASGHRWWTTKSTRVRCVSAFNEVNTRSRADRLECPSSAHGKSWFFHSRVLQACRHSVNLVYSSPVDWIGQMLDLRWIGRDRHCWRIRFLSSSGPSFNHLDRSLLLFYESWTKQDYECQDSNLGLERS